MKIIQFDEEFHKIDNLSNAVISDWILDAQWLNNGETFATVSMHNTLQMWTLTLNLVIERQCADKCILYSAHIYPVAENLIIFSGTVFSEVLVWNAQSTVHDKCPVLKRLQGHKVSLFLLLF